MSRRLSSSEHRYSEVEESKESFPIDNDISNHRNKENIALERSAKIAEDNEILSKVDDDRPKTSKQQSISAPKDINDVAFNNWLLNKSIRTKAQDYLSKLRPNRFESDKDSLEVAISLAAVEHLLALSLVDEIENSATVDEKKSKQKSLRAYWMKHMMLHFTFSDVVLEEEDGTPLPKTLSKLLKKQLYEKELIYNALSSTAQEMMLKDSKGRYYLISLKYLTTSKALTRDQEIYNALFIHEMTKLWKNAKTTLRERIISYVSAKREIAEKSNSRINEDKWTIQYLQKEGLQRLATWIEVDDDAYNEDKRKFDIEKAESSNKQFDSYLRSNPPKKMSTEVIVNPPMSFGTEFVAIRPTVQSSLDPSNKPDSEIVSRAYEEWLVIKDLCAAALKCLKSIACPTLQVDEDKQFLRQTSRIMRSSTSSLLNGSINGNIAPLLSSESVLSKGVEYLPPSEKDIAYCIEIGQALKKVDRSLFADWSSWCKDIIKQNNALVLWDFFAPRSCDIHSLAYSQLRSTFMRLLRPGLDYSAVFKSFVQKHRDSSRSESKDDYYYGDEASNSDSKIKLSKKQMQRFLLELGLSLNQSDLDRLVDAFDSSGTGMITLKDFNDFIGPRRDKYSGTLLQLSKKCCWKTTCHETGMANAFAMSYIDQNNKKSISNLNHLLETKANYSSMDVKSSWDGKKLKGLTGTITFNDTVRGDKLIRIEMKERRKRISILRKYKLLKTPHAKILSTSESKDGENEYEQEFDEEDEYEKEDFDMLDQCAFSYWSKEDRLEGLKILLDYTKEKMAENRLLKLITNGKPPNAPILWNDIGHSEQSAVRDDELRLFWKACNPTDLVSFFVLEFGGIVNGKPNSAKYEEIFRDPPSMMTSNQFHYSFEMKGLLPASSYYFRLFCVNGYGKSDYCYKIFTTRSSAPAEPKVAKVSSHSALLRWDTHDLHYEQMEELKKLFNMCETKSQLVEIIDKHAAVSEEMQVFLSKIATSLGVDVSSGYETLINLASTNKLDVEVSFSAFERHCMSVLSSDIPSKKTGQTLTYVVEKCDSEIIGQYSVAFKTNQTFGTLSRLEPSSTYRVRVYSVNVENVVGPKSKSIIIHTLPETPSPPIIHKPILATSITSDSVSLVWNTNKKKDLSSRDPKVMEDILNSWIGQKAEDDGGVNIENAFLKYDTSRSGSIQTLDMINLYIDLGIEINKDTESETLIREALDILDINGDNTISFDHFKSFWNRKELTFTLKRSEGIALKSKTETSLNRRLSSINRMTTVLKNQLHDSSKTTSRPSSAPVRRKQDEESNVGSIKMNAHMESIAVPVVCYRGNQSKIRISGLEPNRLYHFRVRCNGPRSSSELSKPLVVMTKPLAPSTPLLIDKGYNHVRIKWYAPVFGCHKFQVFAKSKALKSSNGNEDWVQMYSGQENIWTSTSLVPDTIYEIRVVALNFHEQVSEPSDILRFKTYPRKVVIDDFKGVGSNYPIECTGDIVVGDTILITERLYKKVRDSKKLAFNPRDSTHGGVRVSTASVASLFTTGNPTAETLGRFIGERFFAAIVTKDNYRTIRELQGHDLKRTLLSRHLWLQIVWQQTSNEETKAYELKVGDVMEREMSTLQTFEIYRKPWRDEANRKSLKEEWQNLLECYHELP